MAGAVSSVRCVPTVLVAALVASLILLAGCATPQGVADREAGDDLARAERAFAAAALRSGVKVAFLDALADDATIFRPGPVEGKTFIAARPDSPIVLEWQPQRIGVSASGDLGYSTGPYRLTFKKTPDQPGFGQSFSVWKRDAAGRWKVLIDHGIEHPGSTGWSGFEVIVPERSVLRATTVAAAEADFARRTASIGLVDAYRAVASRHVRILRDGKGPIDGRERLRDVPDGGARWSWTRTDSGVAGSGDLAWTMGRYRSRAPDGASSNGFYVRVWRAEDGVWKILSDVLAPLAEPVH